MLLRARKTAPNRDGLSNKAHLWGCFALALAVAIKSIGCGGQDLNLRLVGYEPDISGGKPNTQRSVANVSPINSDQTTVSPQAQFAISPIL